MKPKTCSLCGHSAAAHVDKRCALCDCTSEPRRFVQESLAFRSTLPARVTSGTRKR